MAGFDTRLSLVLCECVVEDPNDLWGAEGSIAFIFTPNGRLFRTKPHKRGRHDESPGDEHFPDRHYELIWDHAGELGLAKRNPKQRYYGNPQTRASYKLWRDVVRYREGLETRGTLVGRYAHVESQFLEPATSNGYVAFWNDEPDHELLIDCLRELSRKGIIDDNTIVVIPNHEHAIVADVLRYGLVPCCDDGDGHPSSAAYEIGSSASGEAPTISPREKRAMHLMGPDEKRQTLAQLGALSKKSDYQQELEKIGFVTPGHKYWAATSESQKQKKAPV